MQLKVVSSILGFEFIKKVEFSVIDEFFSKVEYGDISFTLIDPTRLREYDIEIPLFYKNLLNIEDSDEIEIYNIVIIQNPIQNSTINFIAPLIINKTKKLLVQVALDTIIHKDFEITHPISDYL
jgi:flagellar assembly factor FliW